MFQCNVKIYNFNVPLSHMHKSIKEDPEIFLAFDFVLQHSGINKSILQQARLKICSPKSFEAGRWSTGAEAGALLLCANCCWKIS